MSAKSEKIRAYDICKGLKATRLSPIDMARQLCVEGGVGDLSLSTFDRTIGMHRALRFGEQKYLTEDYLHVENAADVFVQAMCRHLFSSVFYPGSPENDPESGLPHKWHALACAAILIHLHDEGIER